MKNITKWLLASAACCLLSLASAQAITVGPLAMSYQNNSPYLVGTVIPGDSTQHGQVARDVAMTNNLLAMSTVGYPSAASQQTLNGSLYSRTTLAAGPLATAVGAVPFTQNDIVNGTPHGGNSVSLSGGIVSITLGQTYQYLVAAYDGSHAGVAVFDISSFNAGDTINLFAFAHPDPAHSGDLLGSTSGNYFMTSFTLLNPTGGVPDGGATVMLLGTALGALGMVRRYLAS